MRKMPTSEPGWHRGGILQGMRCCTLGFPLHRCWQQDRSWAPKRLMRPTGCSHWVPQTMPSKLGTLRTVIGAWVWMSSSAATLTFRAMLPKPVSYSGSISFSLQVVLRERHSSIASVKWRLSFWGQRCQTERPGQPIRLHMEWGQFRLGCFSSGSWAMRCKTSFH